MLSALLKIFYLWPLVLLLSGCATSESTPTLTSMTPSLSVDEVIPFLPSRLKDRAGWAEDIIAAIEKTGRPATPERVCASIAIIEQESGFQTDPAVKNLPEIVQQGLKKKFRKLGPMAGLAVKSLLKTKVPGGKESFKQRIAKLKTESDLDHLFRDIEASIRDRFPLPAALASLATKLMGKGWLEDFNPVTTAGSMQVKVSHAKTLTGFKSLSDAEVRDLLYTRKGGVRAGVDRLLDYEAKYDDVIYRFADYNVGVYSSRNAAFQTMLSDLSGHRLIADGDLLAYEADGDPSDETTNSLKALIAFSERHDISEQDARRTARDEKSPKFERSDLWKEVRSAWKEKTGKDAYYARIPNVALESPKLSSQRSTEWFAKSVKRRYEGCRARALK